MRKDRNSRAEKQPSEYLMMVSSSQSERVIVDPENTEYHKIFMRNAATFCGPGNESFEGTGFDKILNHLPPSQN
jgi:hypothetical protein